MRERRLRFMKSDGSEYPSCGKSLFGEAMEILPNNTLARDDLSYAHDGICNIHYGDVLIRFGTCLDVSSERLPTVVDPNRIRNLESARLRNGDIIIADTAEDSTVGKATEIFGCNGKIVVSGLHTIPCRPKNYFAPGFLGYYLNSPAYHDQLVPLMQSLKVTSITRKAVQEETYLSVPCLEEQRKIASLMIALDAVIAHTKAEVDAMELQKRGAIQKIFSQQVRFKSKEDVEYPPWKEIKFGSLLDEYREKTTIENEDTLLSCAISGVYLNSELFDHQRGKSNVGYLKVYYGTLILSAQNLHLGNANVNLRFDHGIISPAYKTYRIRNCNLQFVAQWIKRPETKRFFYEATTVGASQCRRNINWNALYEQSVLFPCLEEQQDIANVMIAFDEAIDLARSELEKWKLLKMGFEQQLFE